MDYLLKTKRLVLEPAWLNDHSAEFAEAIHQAGDFELYFGIPESKLYLNMLSISRPMFFNILDKKNGSFIGYIGFHREGSGYEFEIYILAPYRRCGYAKEALTTTINAFFNDDIDGIENCNRIVSSVRLENTASHALMKSLGFLENTEIVFCTQTLITEQQDTRVLKLKYYYITKEMLVTH